MQENRNMATNPVFPFDFRLRSNRRSLLLAPLLAALPLGLSAGGAKAINPSETQVTLPDQINWAAWTGGPPHSAEMATLFGGLDEPGEYVVLMKWYPGYMSAPHTYVTDRLCLVLSGTWWVNSGANFDPNATVPVPAGVSSDGSPARRITMVSRKARRSRS
jgi:hypothetical protein